MSFVRKSTPSADSKTRKRLLSRLLMCEQATSLDHLKAQKQGIGPRSWDWPMDFLPCWLSWWVAMTILEKIMFSTKVFKHSTPWHSKAKVLPATVFSNPPTSKHGASTRRSCLGWQMGFRKRQGAQLVSDCKEGTPAEHPQLTCRAIFWQQQLQQQQRQRQQQQQRVMFWDRAKTWSQCKPAWRFSVQEMLKRCWQK